MNKSATYRMFLAKITRERNEALMKLEECDALIEVLKSALDKATEDEQGIE